MERACINFVIPVYNTPDNYLKDCLNSIALLNYNNFKVFLIDDGSSNSDSIETICDLFDPNHFKYYYKHTSGVSDTRNFGLSLVEDGFVFFVDSDDKIDPENLSVFLQNTDFAFDLCSFSNFIITSNGKISKKIKDSNGAVWGKLFNFEIIKKNNMQFDKRIKYAEDSLFLEDFKEHSSKVIENPSCIYYYRKNLYNTTHRYNPNAFEDFDLTLKEFSKLLDTKIVCKLAFSFFYTYVLNMFVYHPKNKMKSSAKKEIVKIKLKDKTLIYCDSFENLKKCNLPWKMRIMYCLYKAGMFSFRAWISRNFILK